MLKKSILATLVLAALAAGFMYDRADPGAVPTRPAQVKPVPAAVTIKRVPAEQPKTTVEADSALDSGLFAEPKEGEILQTLKGRDFTLRLSATDNDRHRYLEIAMADGQAIELLRTLEGHGGELVNATFPKHSDFALIDFIPGEAREQIVLDSSEWLMRGEGALDTYTLYRIEGKVLQELFSVITKREREDGNGPPPLELEARVERTTRDGQPAFVYHVKAGDAPERSIVFAWNGKRFEDASGEYAKIAQQYAP